MKQDSTLWKGKLWAWLFLCCTTQVPIPQFGEFCGFVRSPVKLPPCKFFATYCSVVQWFTCKHPPWFWSYLPGAYGFSHTHRFTLASVFMQTKLVQPCRKLHHARELMDQKPCCQASAALVTCSTIFFLLQAFLHASAHSKFFFFYELWVPTIENCKVIKYDDYKS